MKICLMEPPSKVKIRGLHMGLGSLAAVLKREGHEVDVIDFVNKGDDVDTRLDWVVKGKPQIIGMTIRSDTLKSANELAAKFKKKLAHTKLIAGGAEVSLQGIQFLNNNSSFDFAIVGEGEETIVELLKVVEGKGSLSNVKGICFKTNGKSVQTEKRELVSDLDSLPFPDYTCFDSVEKNSNNTYSLPENTPFTIFTSRGCPYSCSFCSSYLVWSRRYRAQSPERILEEIRYNKSLFGIKEFSVLDDNFTFLKERVLEFCELLKKSRMDLRWGISGVRGNEIDEELVITIKEAGCDQISLGIESANREVLKKIRKGETIETIERGIRLARKHGIHVTGFFIIGLPGSNYETELESIMFAEKTGIDQAAFYPADPQQGTEFEKWVDHNAIKLEHGFSEKLKNMEIVNRELYRMNFETSEFPSKDRIRIYYKGNLRFNSIGFFIGSKPIGSAIKTIRLIWKYDKERFVQDNYKFFKEVFYHLIKNGNIPKKFFSLIKS